MQQEHSKAETCCFIQAQSKDFQIPEDKQQKPGNGVSVQPPKGYPGFSQLRVGVEQCRGPRAWGLTWPALCIPKLQGEVKQAMEQHRAQQQALETQV